jgi:ATP-dependent DNA ligase
VEAKAPPAGPVWVHEIKWDGFRAHANLRGTKVTTYSRTGLDWTDEFDTVSEAVGKLNARSAVLDGELVVLSPGGKPDFQDLRRELGKHSPKLQCYAFDLLELNGRDLRTLPLSERKALLEKLLRRPPEHIQVPPVRQLPHCGFSQETGRESAADRFFLCWSVGQRKAALGRQDPIRLHAE